MQTIYTTQAANDGQSIASTTAAFIDKLRRKGLLTIVLPDKELDFAKGNTIQLLQLLKSVGRTDLSLGRIYEGHINALLLIHLHGNTEQKQRWYADAENGHLFGVWNTEAANGVAWHLQNDESFSGSGQKTFGSGAGLVSRALVTGRIAEGDRKGWQMSIINADCLPESSVDYDSWHPMGMQSSLSYTVDFSGYRASQHDLLGAPDIYYKQPYFGGGAIRFCAVQLGGAEALFNETVAYLKSLNRTDDVYQNIRLGEMAMELTSGNNWLLQAAQHWDAWVDKETKSMQLVAYINLARTAVERICLRVIELSAKCIGARGLMQSYRMEHILRDLQFYLRQPAPDAVLNSAAQYVIQSNQTIESIWNDIDIIN